MAEEEPLPPIEIPWTLASTTQPLAAGEPEETAISLFTFAPDDERLTASFPDERLVYLKVTSTISPADVPPNLPPIAGSALGEGIPCYHVLVDLKIRRKDGGLGTIRPYFHSAAPLHRRWIQTGVVGAETFEGDADAQFMGKSGSQMYESSSTNSRTTSLGASASIGYGPISVGGSARRTTTAVESERAASQVVDTTTREASQERRELVSHHTHVENVLTLLSAKYLGTPYLRFSLAPQPLALLSLDPSDPNLWFSQLLARRSAGIEGIQEYTAAVLVPRDTDFCVEVQLERVCVLDAPPGPLTFDERFSFTNANLVRIMDYLDRVYPPGTPLDEFDVDMVSDLPNPDEFARGVLRSFVFASNFMSADVESPQPNPWHGVKYAWVGYKHMLEVWLDTLRDEYEREAARSPLERGVIVADERILDTCFSLASLPGAGPVVTSTSASAVPLHQIDISPDELDIGGVMADATSVRASVRERAFEAVTRGNLLEERLRVLLGRRRPGKRGGKRLRLDDPALVAVLLNTWARLRAEDPRNLGFDDAVAALGLGAKHARMLKEAGATDLRGIAAAVRGAPRVARYNALLDERPDPGEADRSASTVTIEPVKAAVSPSVADELRRAIGAGLEKGVGKG